MKRVIRFRVMISLALCFGGCVSQPHDSERDAILSLPWQKFDQTLGSGWRVYLARHDYQAAAEVIEVYLKQHPELTVGQRALSHFHAGQMQVHIGRTKAALAHMKTALLTHFPPDFPDDWNIMVSAHIAFVTGDRDKLVALKKQEADLPPARVEWPGCPAVLLEHLGEPMWSWEK